MKGKLSELEMLDLRAERALAGVDDIVSERDRLRLDLAEARKQLDEAVGLLRELLDLRYPVLYGQRRRRALTFVRDLDSGKAKP